jgi:hypothetical protein
MGNAFKAGRLMHQVAIYLLLVWAVSSILNWFFLIGHHNAKFKEKLEYDEGVAWLIFATLFLGFAGLCVSMIFIRFKDLDWRPLTKKEQAQYRLLRTLERNTYESKKV